MAWVITSLRLPLEVHQWLLGHSRAHLVSGHPVQANRDWWNRAPRGPVTGHATSTTPDAAQAPVVDHGRGWNTRGDVFALASPGPSSPEEVLTVMWHVLASGSGLKPHQNLNRIRSLIADPARTADVLLRAAELAAADPAAAYPLLRPGRRTAFPGLGPAFLTKYLYFVGAGTPDHPSLILDARVATALKASGWESLGISAWPTDPHRRYTDLLARWAGEASKAAIDEGAGRQVSAEELELYLFSAGG